jgi:hypothetical protein
MHQKKRMRFAFPFVVPRHYRASTFLTTSSFRSAGFDAKAKLFDLTLISLYPFDHRHAFIRFYPRNPRSALAVGP